MKAVALTFLMVVGVLAPSAADGRGNVIFFHPDGAGVNHWTALRMSEVGPDGRLNWDAHAGTETPPFISAPARRGKSWPFAIAWATYYHVSGGILVRAAGKNAHMVRGVVDSTQIYDIMHPTLFGVKPGR